MNARTGCNTRELRNVEVAPVRAGGRVLPMMMVQVVTAGSVHGRHVGRVGRILGMHAGGQAVAIKHHALVEASIL